MTRTCTSCGAPHSRKGQKVCKPCHATYMREWRKTQILEVPQIYRMTSRAKARAAKLGGNLIPQPCAVCGDTSTEMHHPDYEFPMFVLWLCNRDHLAWHSYRRDKSIGMFAEFLDIARECAAVRNAEQVAPGQDQRVAA